MQSPHSVTIGITGKRLLNDEQVELVKPLLEKAIHAIVTLEQGRGVPIQIMGISPLAQGSDLLFATAMIGLGYKVKAYLPFEQNEYEQDFTNEASGKQFKNIYNSIATEDKSICGSLRTSDRNSLYTTVGRKVVDESDYIIAVWDEQPGQPAGTGDVVKYLLEKNDEQFREEREMREKKAFKKLVIVNYKIPGLKYNFDMPGAIQGNDSLPLYLYEKTRAHDKDSVQLKKVNESIWWTCVILGLLTAVCFALKVAFGCCPQLMSLIELVSLLTIVFILVTGKPKERHSRYLMNRIITEHIRTLKAYFWSGIPLPPEFNNPVFNQIIKHHQWQLGTLNTIKAFFAAQAVKLHENNYRKEPIQELVQQQQNYHQERYAKNEKKFTVNKIISRAVIVLFITVITIHLCMSVSSEHTAEKTNMAHCLFCDTKVFIEQLLLFFTLTLPAVIAALEAWKVFHEFEKHALQSKAMQSYFKEQEEVLLKAGPANLSLILHNIHLLMFYENLDWQISMLDKEPPQVL